MVQIKATALRSRNSIINETTRVLLLERNGIVNTCSSKSSTEKECAILISWIALVLIKLKQWIVMHFGLYWITLHALWNKYTRFVTFCNNYVFRLKCKLAWLHSCCLHSWTVVGLFASSVFTMDRDVPARECRASLAQWADCDNCSNTSTIVHIMVE